MASISVSSIVLLSLFFLGVSIGVIEVKDERSDEIKRANGPWPDCLNTHVDSCRALIGLHADVNFQLVRPGDEIVDEHEFQTNRVRIHVDERDTVTEIPKRG